ncbi:MAG: DsbC family protein [Thalassolituus sp.]
MKKTLLALMSSALISSPAWAADDLKPQVQAAMQNALGPRAMVTEVVPLADGQVYEVMMVDGTVMHMMPDMKHIIADGTLYRLGAGQVTNVSDSRMQVRRAAEMAAIPDKDTVLFKADGEEKAVINVFTDIDCGYCQKLHNEIEDINALGITVRYLAYPRAGINEQDGSGTTESYRKINYVWCQDDRAVAMTEMKTLQGELSQLYRGARSGQQAAVDKFDAKYNEMTALLGDKASCQTPVAAQFSLGRAIGVRGTPAMVTTDGELIPGYLEASKLAERLGL